MGNASSQPQMLAPDALSNSVLLRAEHWAVREDTYWRSLFFFSLYRLLIAFGFFLAAWIFGNDLGLGSADESSYQLTTSLYLLMAIILAVATGCARKMFDLQLTAQVMVDCIFLTLMMHFSGGQKSNIGVMLFIVLAGAGLVGQGRMTLLHASFATLAVLFEQTYRFMNMGESVHGFVQVGLTGVGYFGTAIIARLLAYAVVANESLAWRRGVELRDQQRINQQVIRDMDNGVLVITADQQVVQANPRASDLLKTTIKPGEHISVCAPELVGYFGQTLGTSLPQEFVFSSHGKPLRVRLLSPSDGGHTLVFLQDVAEEQARLQQIKLAALGRLTANIAHEIRNPLSAIHTAADLLADESSQQTRQQLIRIMRNNVHRLNRLVTDVMAVGKRDQAKPENLLLHDQIQEHRDEIALKSADEAQRLAITCPSDVRVRFDREHFHRVLSNLITNGLRYASAAPGAVRVSVTPVSADQVRIDVVDDGPGIEGKIREQIFEPFFTTDSGGTGLGLYIARELCQANRAQIDLLDDSPGAHFRILCRGGEAA